MSEPCPVDVLDAAVMIAQAAGDSTLQRFRSGTEVERKDDGTPVTQADRDAERLARDLIGRQFPADGVIGEEEADTAGTSDRTWFLDPIDGTKSFVHGVPLYGTLLAANDLQGPLLGVIHLPALGTTVWAGRGRGCWVDGVPARVRRRDRLEGAYLMTSAINHWPSEVLTRTVERGVVVRTWGDAYGYALVATGRADAMFDPEANVWDLAPMPVIMAEAGGTFTDLDGRGSPAGGSGLASAGPLHEDLLALLRPSDA